ncbi:hypothetical protein [Emticicia sp. BO119]|uniref:hypothetical protein n=1 Tax=Emticicia sp. BO119 TaxID=2757768 RepID=UPI0015F10429|nr:hypothetical protein [Emticicia sp. BO119]
MLKTPAEKLKIFTYLLLATFTITFTAFRLPVIVYNVALNPDESMFIVGAMTLAENPIYWESVDGCTSGPFSFYAITAFCEFLRQPYDYISARIMGLFLMVSNLLLNFFTLRKFFSIAVATTSIFCVVAFLGTTRHPDFVHFGSEHLPVFLLSIMSFLYAQIIQSSKLQKSHLFWLGFVAGMVLFTKLQAAPIAASIVGLTYWFIYRKKRKQLLSYFNMLTLGGLCVPCLLFASGIYFGFSKEIWVYYIQHNLGYGSDASIISGLLESFNDPSNIFTKIIVVLTILIITFQIIYKKLFKPTAITLFIVVFISSSIFAVFKPGFMFHHYLLLLVFPTTFLLGYFIYIFLGLSNTYIKNTGIATVILITVSSTLIIPLKNEYITTTKRTMSVSPIGKEILKYTLPDEPLIVWGESGKHYLETKRMQGVRWSHTYWGMYSDSLQKLFRKEYIKEFQSKLAPVFIDTHANEGSFILRKDCGYETVPELKKLVNEKYQFLTEIDQQRIFVRNDRLAEIKKNESEIKQSDGTE